MIEKFEENGKVFVSVEGEEDYQLAMKMVPLDNNFKIIHADHVNKKLILQYVVGHKE